jgi:hypothetical protein
MKPKIVSAGRLLALTSALLACFSLTAHAVSLSVTPTSVSNLYSGTLLIQISALTNGETVLVERFLDSNANGTIDAGEPQVQSFLLTDGQVTSMGGIRDNNIPGDEDLAANGQIVASLDFANSPEFSRGSGAQIFRISSPTGRFAAVQQPVTVTQSSLPRQISGTVSSGGSPVPYAWAAAFVQVGSDQRVVSAATADASGNFMLKVTNGTYQVLGFKPAYTGNFGTSPLVTVSGANTNVLVALTAQSLTVSGNVTDTVSGHGIAGVQFFAETSNGDYAALFSDAQGNFSFASGPGQWKLEPSDYSSMLGGYLRAQNKTKVTVTSTSVTGVNVPFTKASALIYGTLKTDQNVPLGAVRIYGSDSNNVFQSTAYTDANGSFLLPVSATTWYFGVDQGASLPTGYVAQQAQATLAPGQAVHIDLIASPIAGYLAGRAVDSNNNPISGGSMMAFANNGPNPSVQLASDGSFLFPLAAGTWILSLDSQTAASHNLVAPQLQFTISAGVSVSNILYVASVASRTISGSVKSATNSPISGLNVFANTTINGTNFNANTTTDANGNYSLAVLRAVWNVGLESQGLSQAGYPFVPSRSVDSTGGNQTANFIVGGQPVGTIFFRQAMGVVGEFGPNATPTVHYPIAPKNYRVMFHVFDDTNPPATSTVLFTGPPGSGLTNAPADPNFGIAQDGTNVYYLSGPVGNPSAAVGGSWTVTYRNNPNTFQAPDPQVFSRIDVPVPTVTLSNGLLTQISWTYKDPNGNPLGGVPPFITTQRIDLFDQNGNILDQSFPTGTSYAYPSQSTYNWANISSVRMVYVDTLTNQYFYALNESSPSLTSAALTSAHTWQFLLNGAAGRNFTVQYSTTLGSGSWTTLYVTNGAASPLTIVDPNSTNTARFYRVLVGP